MHGTKCLASKNEDSWLWHKHIGYVHFEFINKIESKNLVVSLPNTIFSKDNPCDAF